MNGYFDHNATTPLSPPAREAYLEASDRYWHNPSGLYREAAVARRGVTAGLERQGPGALGVGVPQQHAAHGAVAALDGPQHAAVDQVTDQAQREGGRCQHKHLALTVRGNQQSCQKSTPHGDEIIEASKLGADIANVYATRKDALLEQELEYAVKAGEIDLNRANCSAAELAQSIRLAAGGLKQGAADFADYQKKLKGFLPVIFAGLRLD